MIDNEVIIEKQKDYSISFTRCFAMIFIVLCHIFQFYKIEIAWWFNVGVQMFFFISGYLYSNKLIKNPIGFYKARFLKIIVPYYIWVIPVAGVGFIFDKGCGIGQAFHLLILNGADGFSSLSHLWFIPYILMCYLLTPLILNLKFIDGFSIRGIIKSLFLILGLFIFFEFFATFYQSIWIICYVLGIFYGQLESSKSIKEKTMCIFDYVVIVIAAVANSFQLLNQYVYGWNFFGIGTVYRCCHVLLGVSLVIFLRRIYISIFECKGKKLLDLSDDYSYYVYITHQTFILGSFSFLSVFNTFIGCLMLIIVTIASALLLKIISEKISFTIKEKINN